MAKKFTLKKLEELCQVHSEEALNLYNIATESIANLEGRVPTEALNQVKSFRYFSFLPLIIKQEIMYKVCKQILNFNLL